jgi:hypothetical protein
MVRKGLPILRQTWRRAAKYPGFDAEPTLERTITDPRERMVDRLAGIKGVPNFSNVFYRNYARSEDHKQKRSIFVAIRQ